MFPGQFPDTLDQGPTEGTGDLFTTEGCAQPSVLIATSSMAILHCTPYLGADIFVTVDAGVARALATDVVSDAARVPVVISYHPTPAWIGLPPFFTSQGPVVLTLGFAGSVANCFGGAPYLYLPEENVTFVGVPDGDPGDASLDLYVARAQWPQEVSAQPGWASTLQVKFNIQGVATAGLLVVPSGRSLPGVFDRSTGELMHKKVHGWPQHPHNGTAAPGRGEGGV